MPGKILQVRCAKISAENGAQDLAAVQDPCVRICVQGVYRRSPQNICVRDLTQTICKGSPSKTSALSAPGLQKSSVGKISVRDLLAKSLCTDL